MRTFGQYTSGVPPSHDEEFKICSPAGDRVGRWSLKRLGAPEGHQTMGTLSPVAILKGKGHVCGSRLGVRAERRSSGPSRCLSCRGCWRRSGSCQPSLGGACSLLRPCPSPPASPHRDPWLENLSLGLSCLLPGHPLLCLISAQTLFHISSYLPGLSVALRSPPPRVLGQGP